jgi:pSer/pThr/pTyr-binding forkhead associated (FHA) protein
MSDRSFIRVGRGHDADIRVTDISVSRFHAKINMSEAGEFFVEDNRSKFGTLIQLRKPYMLDKNRKNYIQMGRTTLNLSVEDVNAAKQSIGASKLVQ